MKYKVTSKKDCYTILEIFLYMINGKNYEDIHIDIL